MDNLELYQEENRQQLIELNAGISELKTLLETQVRQYQAPAKEIDVKGEVTVNTQKNVSVDNISDVVDALKDLSDVITQSLKENSYKPLESVAIKNIKDAKADSVTVSNLGELSVLLKSIQKDITNNKPIVNVTKQEVVFPTSAGSPIAVRLSDGKSFYNAIAAAVSSSSQLPFVDQFGKQTFVTLTEDGRVPIEQNGGTAQKKLIDDYTTPNVTYVGSAQLGSLASEPHWRIQKIDETLGIAITWTGHGYNATWDDRVTEVYT